MKAQVVPELDKGIIWHRKIGDVLDYFVLHRRVPYLFLATKQHFAFTHFYYVGISELYIRAVL